MPFYDFRAFRPTLNDFFEKRVASEEAGNKKDGIERYWAAKNSESMDGLPGMRRGVETAKREGVEPIKKMVGAAALKQKNNVGGMDGVSPVLVALVSFLVGVVVAILAMEYARGGLSSGFADYSEEIRALVREIRGHD